MLNRIMRRRDELELQMQAMRERMHQAFIRATAKKPNKERLIQMCINESLKHIQITGTSLISSHDSYIYQLNKKYAKKFSAVGITIFHHSNNNIPTHSQFVLQSKEPPTNLQSRSHRRMMDCRRLKAWKLSTTVKFFLGTRFMCVKDLCDLDLEDDRVSVHYAKCHNNSNLEGNTLTLVFKAYNEDFDKQFSRKFYRLVQILTTLHGSSTIRTYKFVIHQNSPLLRKIVTYIQKEVCPIQPEARLVMSLLAKSIQSADLSVIRDFRTSRVTLELEKCSLEDIWSYFVEHTIDLQVDHPAISGDFIVYDVCKLLDVITNGLDMDFFLSFDIACSNLRISLQGSMFRLHLKDALYTKFRCQLFREVHNKRKLRADSALEDRRLPLQIKGEVDFVLRFKEVQEAMIDESLSNDDNQDVFTKIQSFVMRLVGRFEVEVQVSVRCDPAVMPVEETLEVLTKLRNVKDMTIISHDEQVMKALAKSDLGDLAKLISKQEGVKIYINL